jgi:hypothetical protein
MASSPPPETIRNGERASPTVTLNVWVVLAFPRVNDLTFVLPRRTAPKFNCFLTISRPPLFLGVVAETVAEKAELPDGLVARIR